MNKMNSIIEKIKIVLEENSEINIDGFIRFRMKELREDVDSIVNNIIESYMVEKEYQEFVKLLKYFVDIQDWFQYLRPKFWLKYRSWLEWQKRDHLQSQ